MRWLPLQPALLRYCMTSTNRGFSHQVRDQGRREREQIYPFCTKARENTINGIKSLTCRDTGHHQHQHVIPMILGLWMIRVQQRLTPTCKITNSQNCGSCCYVVMFLIFDISELSILKPSALCPLSPRCKPPPCASL